MLQLTLLYLRCVRTTMRSLRRVQAWVNYPWLSCSMRDLDVNTFLSIGIRPKPNPFEIRTHQRSFCLSNLLKDEHSPVVQVIQLIGPGEHERMWLSESRIACCHEPSSSSTLSSVSYSEMHTPTHDTILCLLFIFWHGLI